MVGSIDTPYLKNVKIIILRQYNKTRIYTNNCVLINTRLNVIRLSFYKKVKI